MNSSLRHMIQEHVWAILAIGHSLSHLMLALSASLQQVAVHASSVSLTDASLLALGSHVKGTDVHFVSTFPLQRWLKASSWIPSGT